MNETVADIKAAMYGAGYLCDEQTATVLYLAETMGKAILVEGPAGVGKTAVAQAFARCRGSELIRLQCYEGIDEARALYEWNYKRQLLHIQAASGRDRSVEEVEKEIFSEEFLLERPLLKAIRSPQRPCLLIDEIDKVDFEFEAMLLELLSEYQVSLPELGTITARQIPYVFLTSNATRELSEALKRRCLYIYLEFPEPEVERQILAMKVPGLDERLVWQLVKAMQHIRSLKLKKVPSIAETIDWGKALAALGKDVLDQDVLFTTLSTIIKYPDDVNAVRKEAAKTSFWIN